MIKFETNKIVNSKYIDFYILWMHSVKYSFSAYERFYPDEKHDKIKKLHIATLD